MKKVKSIILSVLFCVFACLCMTSCGNVSKEDYDNLNNRYNEALQEKNRLEKNSNWLDLYKSIKMDKSFNEISAMFDFEYATHDGCQGVSDDGSTYVMDVYTWKNADLFDIYNAAENQIVVVFLDDASIFKQYGNLRFVLDDKNVRFPSPIKG